MAVHQISRMVLVLILACAATLAGCKGGGMMSNGMPQDGMSGGNSSHGY